MSIFDNIVKKIHVDEFGGMSRGEANDFLGIVYWDDGLVKYALPDCKMWSSKNEFFNYFYQKYRGTEYETEILAEMLT